MEYVEALKLEMLANPTTDIAPIIGVVRLQPDEHFDERHPESYLYETIGGNHSRIALSQLKASGDDLPRQYHFRMVSVYHSSISDEHRSIWPFDTTEQLSLLIRC